MSGAAVRSGRGDAWRLSSSQGCGRRSGRLHGTYHVAAAHTNARRETIPANSLTAALAWAVGVAAMAGCARSHAATAQPISVASAFVLEVSGDNVADGYLVIQNSGPADRLTGVSSSAGGPVLLRGPGRPGSPAASAHDITIPAHSMVRLDPTGMHLVFTHLEPGRKAAVITLTLVFAHAGTLRVAARVTNPQTDNGGYFGL